METQLDRDGEEEYPLTSQKWSNTTGEWMDRDIREFYVIGIRGE